MEMHAAAAQPTMHDTTDQVQSVNAVHRTKTDCTTEMASLL